MGFVVCKKCNKETGVDANICIHCGETIDDSIKNVDDERSRHDVLINDINNHNHSSVPFIILGISLILIIACGCLLWFSFRHVGTWKNITIEQSDDVVYSKIYSELKLNFDGSFTYKYYSLDNPDDEVVVSGKYVKEKNIIKCMYENYSGKESIENFYYDGKQICFNSEKCDDPYIKSIFPKKYTYYNNLDDSYSDTNENDNKETTSSNNKENNTTNESDNVVYINVFYGDGCTFCKSLKSFLTTTVLQKYGKNVSIRYYEVWYNADNNKLMNDVSNYFNETVRGVPYMVIGEKTFSGYISDFDTDIINTIDKELIKENRFDIITYLKK